MSVHDFAPHIINAPGRAHPPGAQPMLHVLLVAPFAPRGGGMGRIMAYLAAAEDARDIGFTLVESRGGGSALFSAVHVARAAGTLIKLAAWRKQFIVHVNVGEGASVLRKGVLLTLARWLGMRTLIHLHAADMFGFHARLPRSLQWGVGALFRKADACVVLGPTWRDWLTGQLGVEPSRVHIVRNGVPQPQVARSKAGGADFVLLFLGNLLPRKGVVDLLHAVAALHSAVPWRLVMAGGGEQAAMRSLAAQLGIDERVVFTGWVEREAATALLAGAGLLVLPSYHEALPLVLLEAAALGTPMIASRAGAVPDLFTDGLDALLVTPGDRLALTHAMARLIADPALRDRLVAGAARLYRSDFSMDMFTARLRAIYRQLARAE